jgi:hypothetical protein
MNRSQCNRGTQQQQQQQPWPKPVLRNVPEKHLKVGVKLDVLDAAGVWSLARIIEVDDDDDDDCRFIKVHYDGYDASEWDEMLALPFSAQRISPRYTYTRRAKCTIQWYASSCKGKGYVGWPCVAHFRMPDHLGRDYSEMKPEDVLRSKTEIFVVPYLPELMPKSWLKLWKKHGLDGGMWVHRSSIHPWKTYEQEKRLDTNVQMAYQRAVADTNVSVVLSVKISNLLQEGSLLKEEYLIGVKDGTTPTLQGNDDNMLVNQEYTREVGADDDNSESTPLDDLDHNDENAIAETTKAVEDLSNILGLYDQKLDHDEITKAAEDGSESLSLNDQGSESDDHTSNEYLSLSDEDQASDWKEDEEESVFSGDHDLPDILYKQLRSNGRFKQANSGKEPRYDSITTEHEMTWSHETTSRSLEEWDLIVRQNVNSNIASDSNHQSDHGSVSSSVLSDQLSLKLDLQQWEEPSEEDESSSTSSQLDIIAKWKVCGERDREIDGVALTAQTEANAAFALSESMAHQAAWDKCSQVLSPFNTQTTAVPLVPAVGLEVDILDADGIWTAGRVIEVTLGSITVHFDGWPNDVWDDKFEWPEDAHRIAPRCSHTKHMKCCVQMPTERCNGKQMSVVWPCHVFLRMPRQHQESELAECTLRSAKQLFVIPYEVGDLQQAWPSQVFCGGQWIDGGIWIGLGFLKPWTDFAQLGSSIPSCRTYSAFQAAQEDSSLSLLAPSHVFEEGTLVKNGFLLESKYLNPTEESYTCNQSQSSHFMPVGSTMVEKVSKDESSKSRGAQTASNCSGALVANSGLQLSHTIASGSIERIGAMRLIGAGADAENETMFSVSRSLENKSIPFPQARKVSNDNTPQSRVSTPQIVTPGHVKQTFAFARAETIQGVSNAANPGLEKGYGQSWSTILNKADLVSDDASNANVLTLSRGESPSNSIQVTIMPPSHPSHLPPFHTVAPCVLDQPSALRLTSTAAECRSPSPSPQRKGYRRSIPVALENVVRVPNDNACHARTGSTCLTSPQSTGLPKDLTMHISASHGSAHTPSTSPLIGIATEAESDGNSSQCTWQKKGVQRPIPRRLVPKEVMDRSPRRVSICYQSPNSSQVQDESRSDSSSSSQAVAQTSTFDTFDVSRCGIVTPVKPGYKGCRRSVPLLHKKAKDLSNDAALSNEASFCSGNAEAEDALRTSSNSVMQASNAQLPSFLPFVGLELDALDAFGIWNRGCIVGVMNDCQSIKVHYAGWNSTNYDEILAWPDEAHRLAPPYSNTRRLRCTFRLPHGKRTGAHLWPCQAQFQEQGPSNHDKLQCAPMYNSLETVNRLFVKPYASAHLPPTWQDQIVDGGLWIDLELLKPWKDYDLNHEHLDIGIREAYLEGQNDCDVLTLVTTDIFENGALLKEQIRIESCEFSRRAGYDCGESAKSHGGSSMDLCDEPLAKRRRQSFGNLWELHGITDRRKATAMKLLRRIMQENMPDLAACAAKVAEFFLFVYERQCCWERRHQGENPVSSCPVLQQYFFCNNFRELDRGTCYFRSQVLLRWETGSYRNRSDWIKVVIFTSFVYRQSNLMTFQDYGCIPSIQNWSHFEDWLKARGSLPPPDFDTGACRSSRITTFLRRVGDLLKFDSERLKLTARSIVEASEAKKLNDCFDVLKELPGRDELLAFQVLCDLLESRCLGGCTEYDWIKLSSASAASLRSIFPHQEMDELELAKSLFALQAEVFGALGVNFPLFRGRYLSLKNIEHALSSYQNYLRIKRQLTRG